MSYTKEVTLWCDADGCVEWTQLNNHESKGGMVEAARVSARRERWSYISGKDYCREHSAVVQEIVADPIFDGPSVSLHELRAQAAAEGREP